VRGEQLGGFVESGERTGCGVIPGCVA
jgi:hypothetical protein